MATTQTKPPEEVTADPQAVANAKAMAEAFTTAMRALRDDDKPKHASTDDESEGDTTYVVLTDGITVQTGRTGGRSNKARRYGGGRTFRFPAKYPASKIERLVATKAIAVHDGDPKQRTNPRALAAASAGIDDPALVPLLAFVPTTLAPDHSSLVAKGLVDPTLEPDPNLDPLGAGPPGSVPDVTKPE